VALVVLDEVLDLHAAADRKNKLRQAGACARSWSAVGRVGGRSQRSRSPFRDHAAGGVEIGRGEWALRPGRSRPQASRRFPGRRVGRGSVGWIRPGRRTRVESGPERGGWVLDRARGVAGWLGRERGPG
jgi:hypothetical protein